jgi:hypothetical protein
MTVAVSRVTGREEGRKSASGLDRRGATLERAGGRERDCRVLVGVEFGRLRTRLGPCTQGHRSVNAHSSSWGAAIVAASQKAGVWVH